MKVLTNALGQWNIKIADNWTGNITATFGNYTSLPASILLTGPYDNMAPVEFILNPPGDYKISGTVRDQWGNPLQGVLIGGLNGTLRTDINGFYSIWVGDTYAGNISASFSNYVFNPSDIHVVSMTADLHQQDFVQQKIVTGIKDIPGIHVALYPNPSHTSCNISLDTPAEIRVYSIQGTLMLSTKLESGDAFGENLSAGLYMVHIHSGNLDAVVKFIKK